MAKPKVTKKSEMDKEDCYFRAGGIALQNWHPGDKATGIPEAQVIDMFCGCGGMSLGFASIAKALGGFELIGGIDINETSLTTYNRNFKVPAQRIDVRLLATSKSAISSFVKSLPNYDPKRKTVLIGCVPCQGFTAHRKKHWKQPPDNRNNLVEAFADIAASLGPECVIMENVPELLSGRYWAHFEYLRNRLQASGYIVKQAIHNAAAQGVAQKRFRAVIIAMRSDFAMPKERLTPKNFKTVRDAIGDLETITVGKPSSADPMHKCANHRASTIEIIKAVPFNGGSRPPGIGPKCLQNIKGFSDVYGRLAWNKPSITITHYARNPASGRYVHPKQHRGLSMREVARLQSFPDGFEFMGSFDDVYRQIGEAVPPLLALAIASSTLANLRGETKIGHDDLVLAPFSGSFADCDVIEKRRNQ